MDTHNFDYVLNMILNGHRRRPPHPHSVWAPRTTGPDDAPKKKTRTVGGGGGGDGSDVDAVGDDVAGD